MQVSDNDKTDLLYIRLDGETQEVINRDVADGITVDIGAGDRIVGIEILDASRRLDLRQCSVEPPHGGTEDKEGTMELTISVQMWKKDNWYIAKCPELDFVSEGGDPAEARRNLLEVVEIQLEEMTELGTLDEYLSECGYVHEGVRSCHTSRWLGSRSSRSPRAGRLSGPSCGRMNRISARARCTRTPRRGRRERWG